MSINQRDRAEPQSRYIVNPYPALARLRDSGPVAMVHSAEGLPVWIVTGYEAARAALNDSSIRQGAVAAQALAQERHPGADLGGGVVHMLNSDPPDHTRLRQLIHGAFTARRVAALRPAIGAITGDLLERLAGPARDGRTTDLVRDFALPLPMLVIGRLLGFPAEDAGLFRNWSTAILTIGAPGASAAAADEMTAYLGKLLAVKRRRRDRDMLGDLLRAQDEGRLTEDEIVAMAFLLVIGGHETTVNLISTAVLALLRNPDQRAWLADHLDQMPTVIDEFLRYEAPVSMATLRFTTEPVILDGHRIEAGEFLLISLGGANRDPQRFPEPERLLLDRPDRGHLAFGHGIHRCLGAFLGKLEGEVALTGLLARFPNMALADEDLELRWRNTTMLRGLESLPVRLYG